MSVSGITSSPGGYDPSAFQSKFGKLKADFQSLSSALQSGNMSDAQQAFATLQSDLPNKPANGTNGSSADGANPMSALSSALLSGNLAGAQQAFAALQQSQKGHHHHHGGQPGAASVSDPSTSDSVTNGTSSGLLDATA